MHVATTSRPLRRPALFLVVALLGSLFAVGQPPARADHDLPPAVNGPIAFVANHDIWYRDSAGAFHRVTRGMLSPAWDLELSPDGRRIAFSIPSSEGLWVVNLNGTNLRNVIAEYTGPGGVLGGQSGYDPSWDPSGHRLVFTAYDKRTGNHELFTVDADEPGSLTRLTRFGVGSDAVPTWSPVRGSNTIAYIPCCNGRIKTIDAVTRQETWITADEDPPADSLDWSPDGSMFVVEAYTDGRLYTVNSDGTDWVYLDPGSSKGLAEPSWSPDGTMIAVEGLDSDKETAVLLIDPTKGVPGGLTEVTGDWGNVEFAPTWGPECTEQCTGTELTVKAKKRPSKINVSGKLLPGVTGKKVVVSLHRLVRGKWREVAAKSPKTKGGGKYSASFKRPKSGKCGVLVEFKGSKQHMPSYQAVPPFKC